MFLLSLVLNLIKAFAINTDDGTLTDKSIRIYLADKAEMAGAWRCLASTKSILTS